MYYFYALESLKDSHLYIGISENPDKRLREHNYGSTKSTKNRRPFKIIFKESCENRVEARKREIYFKGGSGREFLRGLLGRNK